MSPSNAVVLVLGIPIDDLTLESAVRQTLDLADAWRQDGRPRQIATVNVDFLTNSLGWTPGAAPRHPELLEILRRADRVTADGMPIVWLARLLGTPMQGRVTGADLVPALARAMASSGHRLYLLGGRGDIGQQAAQKLQQQYPGLQIAGVDSPFVHIEGEALLDSEADDAEIVERINRVQPDVLLMGFGNPKQEVWFHRNRHRLKAGVSMGVGGTFEFIVGRVSRAPEWMQRSGLEWIYRITQDPKRLWKRYAVGLAKLAVMGIPLVLYYRWRRLRYRAGWPFAVSRSVAVTHSPSHPSPEGSRAEGVLILPELVDAAWVQAQAALSVPASADSSGLAVDFTAARFIDAFALGYLARLWKSAQNNNLATRSVGLEQTAAARLLKVTRMWDVFSETTLSAGVVTSGVAADGLITFANPVAGIAIACLNGRLDFSRMAKLNVEVFASALGDGDCVLDLSGLGFVDSRGLGLLIQLQRRFSSRGREVVLCGLQPPVRQLLEITRLTNVFCLVSNREQALALIASRRRERCQPESGPDYFAKPSCLDYILRILYAIAYRAEMAINFLIRPRVEGAYVAVWYHDRILLIRNSYKSYYTLPCGKIRRGEYPMEAARRELREEVGIDLELSGFRQSFTAIERSEFKKDHIHLFETQLEQTEKICPDGREVVWAGFRTPEEALGLPLFPPVKSYLMEKTGHARSDRL